MTTDTAAAPSRGPTALSERAFTPDFARGLMLLLIVVSNTALHLYGASSTAAIDAVTRFAEAVVIDVRTYPLFAFLFGYGVTQLAARQRRIGTEESRVRRILRRRGLWLVGFGAVHAALLLATEVLAAYGLLSLVLIPLFLWRRDRTLLIGAAVGAGVVALGYLASGALLWLGVANTPESSAALGALGGVDRSEWFIAMLERIASWIFVLGLNSFGMVMATAMLLGMWAARKRILEEPQRHLRLLSVTAVAGVGIGLTGSLPTALAVLNGEYNLASEYGGLLYVLQWTSGLAGGLGYIGLFGLLGYRVSRRANPGTPVRAITALGRRSLSGYLTHSLLMAPLLTAWGLGLGGVFSVTGMALFAFGLWLLTVVGAYLMERRGIRGPAEVLLRRLVYR